MTMRAVSRRSSAYCVYATALTTNVEYGGLGVEALERLVGAGVFYGAAGVEAPALFGEQVYCEIWRAAERPLANQLIGAILG
jgi:hypothetical protein